MGSGASHKARDADSAESKPGPAQHGEELESGCVIPEVADRAITVQQLQDLTTCITTKLKAEGWTTTDPSVTKPVKLKKGTVNLYDVVARLVKPATEKRRCSYVELVATGPQTTRWFVSHWWGEPVFHFVACVVKHSEQRRLGSASTYWVCAYANNQWELAYDVAANPAESSFRRALDVAEGTLSILDDAARAYERVWCEYEVFVTLEKAKRTAHLFDIYTYHNHQPRGITDGITEGDRRGASWWWEDRKWAREKNFPVELAEAAMQAQVQLAVASVDADRIHILNSIVGAGDLNSDPPLEHERYDVVNTTLHARFALAALKLMVEARRSLHRYVQVISSSQVTRINLSFRSDQVLSDDTVQQLAAALPATLKDLCLNMVDCTLLTDQGIQALALALEPLPLESLHLDIAKNALSDEAVQAVAASFGESLRHLWFSIGNITDISDVSGESLATALPSRLESMFLSLAGCRKITGKTLESLGRAFPPTLSHVELMFGSCHLLDNAAVEALLAQLPEGLLDLRLDFWGCSQLTEAMLLGLAAALPSSVTRVELYLGEIPKISGQQGRRFAQRELLPTPDVLQTALRPTVSVEYFA
ncbi:unnamed protein product [Symbiodinium sp. KB8]|nr:unnamed protein product [Symbiodinium sp. KB8]